MPNSLQLGLAPCSSRHHSCASVGPCPRPEVRGQERLLVGGPDRSSSSGSQGGARRTSAWWRIPGRPLPWLSPLIPVPPCFRGSPFSERNSTAVRIAGLQESGPSQLVSSGRCPCTPQGSAPRAWWWHQTLFPAPPGNWPLPGLNSSPPLPLHPSPSLAPPSPSALPQH